MEWLDERKNPGSDKNDAYVLAMAMNIGRPKIHHCQSKEHSNQL